MGQTRGTFLNVNRNGTTQPRAICWSGNEEGGGLLTHVERRKKKGDLVLLGPDRKSVPTNTTNTTYISCYVVFFLRKVNLTLAIREKD